MKSFQIVALMNQSYKKEWLFHQNTRETDGLGHLFERLGKESYEEAESLGRRFLKSFGASELATKIDASTASRNKKK